MAKSAERTDPELWEKVKKEITRSSKGGRPGQWSARKAQIAVQVYRERGGGYRGGKSADNALQQWQDEEWGTKSGRNSLDSGERYLSKAARDALSGPEHRSTSQKKRADTAEGRQFSPQPADVAAKSARHRDSATKAELYQRAKARHIPGRSRMSKAELARALG